MTNRAKTIFVIAIIAVRAAGQDGDDEESWVRFTVEAQSLLECRSASAEKTHNPVTAAVDRYDRALAALDASRTGKDEVARTRGAARARIVRDREMLLSKQKVWDSSLRDAMKLLGNHTPQSALTVLNRESPPSCWEAFREAKETAENEQKLAIASMREGERLLSQARAALSFTEAAAVAANAEKVFRLAYEHDREIPNAPHRQAQAERVRTDASKPLGSNEIVIFSNPAANVTLLGRFKSQGCMTTPCRLKFDAAYFDSSGGSFLDSKRLHEPVVAQVSSTEFNAARVLLTQGPSDWSGKMPGGRAHVSFHYFGTNHFEVRLIPARPR
jgi:hypothetical protein